MRSHLKRLGAAAIFVSGTSPVDRASAADDFNDRTLRGTWAFFVEGYAGDDNALTVPGDTPLFAVGTVTFDGRDGCGSRDRIGIGNRHVPDDDDPNAPVEFREAESCSYAVEPDGTGSLTVTFRTPGRRWRPS